MVSLGLWQGLRGGEALPPPQFGVTSALTHRLRTGCFSGFVGNLSSWGWEMLGLSNHSRSVHIEPERLQFLTGPAWIYGMCNHIGTSYFSFSPIGVEGFE